MVKFLLYLLESGMCLSLLYLVYIFFFRQETYFRFNRTYLVSIIFISLLLPFIHFSFHVENINRYENSIRGISKIKNYYEQLIAMTDPDFLERSKIRKSSGFDEMGYYIFTENTENGQALQLKNNSEEPAVQAKSTKKLSIARVLFIAYLFGVVFFISRLLLLFSWIRKTIKNNPAENFKRNKIVYLKENIPPFSFLRYIFINENGLTNEKKEKILTHETIHVNQLHSVDLILAHLLATFQWFNPFAWLLHRNIKINHEYIADNEVVRKGYNLLEYQELILKQFIPIPYIELVNNFNLISIKKRIAMMNKIKSGFIAKLKALLVIPASIIVFFLFANLTINGSGKVLKNFSLFDSQKNLEQLKGMWKNTSDNDNALFILFENQKFSVLEKTISLREYPYQLKENQIILNLPNKETTVLNFELNENKLKIWWSSTEYAIYEKSLSNNSLDDYLSELPEKINLPKVENFWVLERTDLCIDVAMVNNKIYVNKKPVLYSELKDALLKEKSKVNQLNAGLITIKIYADKDLSMKYMADLNQTLREIGLLKVAHMGISSDNGISKLQANYIGMAKRLPPLNVPEIDFDKLNNDSIALFRIDATDKNQTPETVKPKFKEVVSTKKRYVASLYYDKSTLFETYLGYTDMARTVIYYFRNEYAEKNYHMKFDNLSSAQQAEIKTIYPLIISEAESFRE